MKYFIYAFTNTVTNDVHIGYTLDPHNIKLPKLLQAAFVKHGRDNFRTITTEVELDEIFIPMLEYINGEIFDKSYYAKEAPSPSRDECVIPGGTPRNPRMKCPHCNAVGSRPSIFLKHFDYCKSNPNPKVRVPRKVKEDNNCKARIFAAPKTASRLGLKKKREIYRLALMGFANEDIISIHGLKDISQLNKIIREVGNK